MNRYYNYTQMKDVKKKEKKRCLSSDPPLLLTSGCQASPHRHPFDERWNAVMPAWVGIREAHRLLKG